ncbi:MAG: YtxH domain-containing protein [Candidatus Gracilibacteria bacterium]|nr:YtxH domain-containing protein [Candidatus Gracilibacteria bacterium]
MAKKGKGFFLIGTVLGSLFGLLFAQRKGDDLRKNLKETYKKKGWDGALETLKKEGKGIAGDVGSFSEEVKQSEQFQKAMKKGKKKAKEIEAISKKRAEELMSVAKKANEAIEKGKKKINKEISKAKKKTAPKKK